LLLIGAVSFALCGCVYLRLLEFKKQLSRFDENFTMPATDDISLQCLHPLLQPDDVRWLGAVPKTTVVRDGGEDWVIRWVKENAPGVKEVAVYDMEMDLRFLDGRVVEARVPKRYLAYVSRELFLNMLRSTGTAKVNKGDHRADARTETPPASALPNLSKVKAMLGDPTRKETSATRIVHFYRYRLDSAESTAKAIEVSFAFDVDSGELRKFTARLPRGTLNYDFVPTAPSPAPTKTGS
jgi:hypothetical protein